MAQVSDVLPRLLTFVKIITIGDMPFANRKPLNLLLSWSMDNEKKNIINAEG